MYATNIDALVDKTTELDVHYGRYPVAVMQRSDGYWFIATLKNGQASLFKNVRLFAGCQTGKTFGEYRRHVNRYREYLGHHAAAAKRKETLAILAALETTIKARWHK